jgi:hypothetical protein
MLLTYFLLLLIVFIGVFVGLLISYFSKEELKPGFQYINALRHMIFLVIIVLFFIYNPDWVFAVIIGAIILLFSFHKHRETLYYYALALFFFLSWKYNGFGLISQLIFLYGITLGSIYLHAHMKEKIKKVILGAFYRYAGFLICGVALVIFLSLLGLIL